MLVSSDYPYLQIKVVVRNLFLTFRALLDTGFDGHLVLPVSCFDQLGEPDFRAGAMLADGISRITPQYWGGIEIVGLNVNYMGRIILLGDECLMGQGIIRRVKITFDHGKEVIVEP